MGTQDIGNPFAGETLAVDGADWLDVFWQQKTLGALQDTLDVSPEITRQMIEFLFASKLWNKATLSWESAGARFAACLNPGKQEKFSTMELWALMKRFGRHQLFLALADDLGYEVRRKCTEERHQDLLARIARAAEAHNQLMGMLAGDLRRLGAEAPAPRVHGAILAGNPSFSLEYQYQEDADVSD